MSEVEIMVYMDRVEPDQVIVTDMEGATTIRWKAAPGVQFEITGLDGNYFDPPSTQGLVTEFVTVDTPKGVESDYEYDCGTKRASGNVEGFDPFICNRATPG